MAPNGPNDPKTLPMGILRHIGLLEADEDKIRKIRPKGTLVTILYVPREAICPPGQPPEGHIASLGTYRIVNRVPAGPVSYTHLTLPTILRV